MHKLLSASLFSLVLPLAAVAGTYTFSDNSNFNALSHGTAYTWGLSGATYSSLVSAVKGGQNLTSATLTFTNIYDWKVEPADVLYVNILKGINAGASSYTYDTSPSTNDTTFGSDYFASSTNAYYSQHYSPYNSMPFSVAAANSLLTYSGSYQTTNPGTWSDPSNGTQLTSGFNLVLTFSAQNLALFQSYLYGDTNSGANPTEGFGFGPDCHYYDSGVCLTVTTGSSTPPPSSVPDSTNTVALVGAAFLGLAGFKRFTRRAGSRR